MSGDYHGHIRSEIAPLLPVDAERIVDVGCGSGATLGWLRQRYPRARLIGVEGVAALEQQILGQADEAHIVDLNEKAPDLGAPDLMLFLDVLEHLPAPERTLADFAANLAPGGTLIVSLPNVAHLSVSLPLALHGEFTYRDAGILDRTHLRFFVRRSCLTLLEGAGFVVDRALYAGLDGRKARLLDAVTFGVLRTRLTKQYILRAMRHQPGAASQAIAWSLAPRQA